MRLRFASTIALAATVALRADGQPLLPSTDEQLIRAGMSRVYAIPKNTLIDALRCHLCTPGYKVMQDTEDDKGRAMICRTLESKTGIVDKIVGTLVFWRQKSEGATPWARVVQSGQSTQVIIGVVLLRNDKQWFVAREHFFGPSDWGQKVWVAIDRWAATSPEARKCNGP